MIKSLLNEKVPDVISMTKKKEKNGVDFYGKLAEFGNIALAICLGWSVSVVGAAAFSFLYSKM